MRSSEPVTKPRFPPSIVKRASRYFLYDMKGRFAPDRANSRNIIMHGTIRARAQMMASLLPLKDTASFSSTEKGVKKLEKRTGVRDIGPDNLRSPSNLSPPTGTYNALEDAGKIDRDAKVMHRQVALSAVGDHCRERTKRSERERRGGLQQLNTCE